MSSVVNELREARFLGLLQVLVEMQLEILGPERLVLEVRRIPTESPFLELYELDKLVEELIPSYLPQLGEAIGVIVKLGISNCQAPALEGLWDIEL